MRSISAAEALEHYGAAFLSTFDDHDSEAETLHIARNSAADALPTTNGACASQQEQSSSNSESEASSTTSTYDEEKTPVYEFINSSVVRQADKTAMTSNAGTRIPGSSNGPSSNAASVATPEDDLIWSGSKVELAALQRQVQTYGAGGLDKRSKKQYDAQRLANLGLKANKKQKMAAAIGKGMKQVQLRREHTATETAIEAGHLSRSTISKQQRKERQTARKSEDSLREDNGAFKGGVMHIKRTDKSGQLRQKRKAKR